MKITPLDIRRKEFKRALRGYSDEEVDIFLDEVADEMERLLQENIELQERVQRLSEETSSHTQLREALEKTLVQAQLQSEEMRANAHRESELILKDAQMKARAIINDSYVETQKVQQTLVQLRQLEEEFRFKFRSLLQGYLKLVDEMSVAPAERRASSGEGLASGEQAEQIAVPVAGAAGVVTPTAGVVTATAGVAGFASPGSGSAEAVSPATAPSEDILFRAAPLAQGAEPSPQSLAEERTIEVRSAGAVRPSPAGPEVSSPSARPGDDEVPTEEVQTPVEEAAPVKSMEEPLPTQEAEESAGEESLRRFFFGRQGTQDDDLFLKRDVTRREKDRDFEW